MYYCSSDHYFEWPPFLHLSQSHSGRLPISSVRSVCGVRKEKAATTVTNLGSVCAALIRRGESPPCREHSLEAWLHRGAVMMPPTASHKRPAMVSRWLRLVTLWKSLRQLPHAGGTTISGRPTRFRSCWRRAHPLSPLPSCTFRLLKRPSTQSLGWSEEKLCTTSDAATSPSFHQKTLLAAMRTCSFFSRVWSRVGPHSMDMQMTSSGSAVLHSPFSFKHCCIFGLLHSSSLSSLSSQGWWCVTHACI